MKCWKSWEDMAMENAVQDKEKDYASYTYKVNKWLELPIDYSQNRLWKELSAPSGADIKVARETITAVLNRVSELEWKAVREDNITYPKAIPYESVELVKALLIAYSKYPRSSPDDLIQHMTEEIASRISKQSSEDSKEDYFNLVMTQYDPVQRSLLSEYFAEVDKRLRLIHDLLFDQPACFIATDEKDILRRLDDILVDLAWNHEVGKKILQEQRDTDTEQGNVQKTDFDLIYENLNHVREGIRGQLSKHIDTFYFELAKEDEDSREIIQSIADVLEDYGRRHRSDCARIFEEPYRRFLIKSLQREGETYQRSIQFLEFYHREREYVAMNLSVKEFEDLIRQELYEFAKDLFDGLKSENHASYSYSFFEAKGSRVAFAATRLKNIHEQLRFALHTPLQLLRISHTLLYYLSPQKQEYLASLIWDANIDVLLGEKLDFLLSAIKQEREKLHKNYAELPLLIGSKRATISRFVSAYNSDCLVIFGTSPLHEQYAQPITDSDSVIQQLRANSMWLECECQLVLLKQIDESVKQVKNEYRILKKYLDKKT